MIEVGSTVGDKFRIERILGKGGMGVVAVATHLQLDQQVALKVMHDQLAEDPAALERFMREARASARLKSDHVCKVSDVGQLASGAPYLVMELLEGDELGKLLQHRTFDVATAADYVLQACVAVAEAHASGIVHRDLKPANLFVTYRLDGAPLVKVLDFGIAKAQSAVEFSLTTTAMMMGSPGYMSPEQLRSARDVDGRTDIWALGVILYELVTGRLPFNATTVMALAVKIATEPAEPLPAELDPRLAAVIARCLEKDLERRYPTITALASELAPIAGAAGTSSASMIVRLSGPQSPVSGPRSAQSSHAAMPTAMTTGPTDPGHRPTTLASAAGPTTPSAPARRGRGLLAIGAVALLGGAGAIGYALTRDTDKPKPAAHKRHEGSAVVIPPDAAVAPIALPVPIDGGLEGGAVDPAIRADIEMQLRNHEVRAVLEFANLEARDPSLAPIFAEARAELAKLVKQDYGAAIKNGQCNRARGLALEATNRHLGLTLDAACTPKEPVVAAPATPVDDRPAARAALAEIDRLLQDGHYAEAMRLSNDSAKKLAHLGPWVYVLAACDAKDLKAAQTHFAKLNPTHTRPPLVRRACAVNHIDLP